MKHTFLTSPTATQLTNDRHAVLDRVAGKLATNLVIEESAFYPGVLDVESKPILARPKSHKSPRNVRKVALETGEHIVAPEVDASAFQAKVTTLKERILRHLRGREDELLPVVTTTIDERGVADLARRMKALFFRRIEAAAIVPSSGWAAFA
jgi:hypothetical protein